MRARDHHSIERTIFRQKQKQIGSILTCGLALFGLLAAGLPASAQGVGDVSVGGEHLLTIRFPAAGMSVQQRADAVTERVNRILADPNLKPSDIVAVPMGKNAAKILVKGQLLVTVEPETARYNQSTAMEVAQIWVRNLRHVLPQINVKPNPNIGEQSTPKPPSK